MRLLTAAVAIVVAFSSSFITPLLHAAPDEYPPHPDSKKQPGVPEGEVLKFEFSKSKIFPGTTRDYWVYVPKQYDPATPACVYINQDAVQWGAPVVFDNLIHKKEMPVTIGIFVTHGKVPAGNTNALMRFNRSFEYDGLGDNYARFLLEELLPDVETKIAKDGRPIKLSKNGNDRMIGGSSSGAVCAFTAAWERPNEFSRVFSVVGTFVGLRGADQYPVLVRKFEPKPLRVFLQDGSNDNNIYGGDWWIMNQAMQRSFAFMGYEHDFVWGEGGHNGKHGTAVFPDAIRYLWKDWPKPVTKGAGSPQLKELLIPGEEWQVAVKNAKGTEGPAANAQGELFFNTGGNRTVSKLGPDGTVSVFAPDNKLGDGQRFGPDGRLYAVASGDSKIVAYDTQGQATVIADGFKGNDLTVAHNGNIYVTESSWDKVSPSKIWLIKPDGSKKVVDQGLIFANGITLSPDQTLLYVSDMKTRWVYSWQVKEDGTLQYKQRYYWLQEPDAQQDAGSDGMRVDRDGRLYVATKLGIQICDQAGRVNCIIPTPNGRVSNMEFGGENFDILYATCGDTIYKRKLKVKGAMNWQPPVKPATPRL
ncbi:MAG TPA: SMP-30/gluconolactonase/LRE family protein [Roseimicrobium sp.]|nr:SMP-30/gluconolactonase/LRE family protein [Roseimicrobium sp.]